MIGFAEFGNAGHPERSWQKFEVPGPTCLEERPRFRVQNISVTSRHDVCALEVYRDRLPSPFPLWPKLR